MRERGQISVAAVAVMAVLVMGGVLLAYLGGVAVSGGQAQRAADLAAIAAAGRLGADPGATASDLRPAAAAAARANGARVASLRIVRSGSVPRAVDVSVTVAADGAVPVAGRQHQRVFARARAGVAYAAALPSRSFRPVDLHGVRGPPAAVAAAEAQVGWPYVWGGESRAEGGFDCSGLIDYAYAVAGSPLPGRPTAADLWRMAVPVSAAALLPADMVFLGAGTGAPFHVGMYVGGGTVVVAPHTGARVRFEPLAGGGWDGFGRLLAPGLADPGPAAAGVEAAARASQVPPDALAAELRLGLARDPRAAAIALAAAMRRHPGDLQAALADALGDASAAALVLRAASGAGPGEGFSATVRLLPAPAAAAVAAPVPRAAVAGRLARARPAGGPGLIGIAGTAAGGLARGADQVDQLGSRLSVQAAAGLRNALRFGLTGAAAFLPDPHLRDMAVLAGAVWDGVRSAEAVVTGGFVLGGASLWAARVTTPLGLVFAGVFAWQAVAARRREDRIWYGAQAAGGLLTSAGALTAGTDLIALGAGTAEVPPLGAALMLAGVTVLAGACIYRERGWLARGARAAAGAAATDVRSAAGRVARAAGAAVDAGRSLAGAIGL